MLTSELSVVIFGLLYKTEEFIFCMSLTAIISGFSQVNQNHTTCRVFCILDCCNTECDLLVAIFFSQSLRVLSV